MSCVQSCKCFPLFEYIQCILGHWLVVLRGKNVSKTVVMDFLGLPFDLWCI